MKKEQRLTGLDGIKIMAIMAVFCCHCIPYCVEWGNAATKLLFVCSGMLVGLKYNSGSMEATFEQSMRYVEKKLVKFYPIHLLTFLVAFVFLTGSPLLTKTNLFNAILNLTLLQAWSPYTLCAFSYNGVSWFLSALLFCALLTPALLVFTKTRKKAIAAFLVFFLTRFLLDWTTDRMPYVFFDINMHSNPFICLLDYAGALYCGTLLQATRQFMGQNNDNIWNTVLFTIIEISIILFTLGLFTKGSLLEPVHYVFLSYLPLVFVFGLNRGWVSRGVFGNPVMKGFAKIQLEFYMFHQQIYFILLKYFGFIQWSRPALVIVTFCMTCFVAVLFNRFLSEKLSRKMSEILEICHKKIFD